MERYEGYERWLRPLRGSDVRQVQVNERVAAQWFHALYESPVLYSGLLDENGLLLEGNRLAVEGCGFTRDEVIGVPFWECGWWSPDPELAGQIERWFHHAMATGESLRAVCRYFLADGEVGMVELDLVPIVDRDSDEGVRRYLVATGLDISDLLASQARREDLMAGEVETSRQAEQRFRNALDAMIDNVYIARSIRDASGEITDFVLEYVKQRSVDHAGRSSDELLGRRVSELYPTWQASGMRDRFVTVVETGEPFIGERLLYRDELPDGTVSERYWDLQVAKIDDGYIASSRDVTDVVHNEEAVRDATVVAERERLAVDALQQAALPRHLPEHAQLRIGVHYQPARQDMPVGGDWYDVFTLADGSIQLIIADVAGHGLEAAAYMLQLRNVLRTIAIEEDDPSALLERANYVALTLHPGETPLTTCCAATLEPVSGALEWAVAGHPPPLVRSPDRPARFIEVRSGPPLGVIAEPKYETHRAALEMGDRLVVYTDGLIERRDAPLDQGMDRLLRGVERTADLAPDGAAEWLASNLSPGMDDVALIVVDLLAST